MKCIRNKAAKGCSHKHGEVPQLSPSHQTPSIAIEEATNNVPYTTKSIEDNMPAEENATTEENVVTGEDRSVVAKVDKNLSTDIDTNAIENRLQTSKS